MKLNALKMMGSGFAIMALFAIMLLPYTPEAYAQAEDIDVTCTDAMLTEDVSGTITVSADSWCTIEGITVIGDVRLLDGATLDVFDSVIGGNLEGIPDTTDVYFVGESLVKGNIVINGVIYIEGTGGNIVVEGEIISDGSGLFRMWEARAEQGVTLKQKNVVDLFDNNFQKFVKIFETNDGTVSETPQINLLKNRIQENLEVIQTSGAIDTSIKVNTVEENFLYKENAGASAILQDNAATKNFDVLNNNDGALEVRENSAGENINMLVNLVLSVFDNAAEKALTIKDNGACTDEVPGSNTGDPTVIEGCLPP